MLDQVLDFFEIKPDYDLNIMKNRQTLIDVTTRGLEGLDTIMKEAQPDIVLVHAKASEEEFVASGAGVERFPVMYNDFVVVGPEEKYLPQTEQVQYALLPPSVQVGALLSVLVRL